MATTFDEVIDLALMGVKDYQLDNLYKKNVDKFQDVCDGFLVKAIPEFIYCKTPLSCNLETRTFNNELKPLEISILADLWVAQWWKRQINDVTQFKLKMSPTDFKHYSEAENLKQKQDSLDKAREMYAQKMVDYGHVYGNWSSWASGNFGI